MPFQAFRHLYKTRLLRGEGARDGDAGGGAGSLGASPLPPPQQPRASATCWAERGWRLGPRRETPSSLCSSRGLSLLPCKMGTAEAALPTPPPPRPSSSCQDPTGQSRKSAWHRALHMAGAE